MPTTTGASPAKKKAVKKTTAAPVDLLRDLKAKINKNVKGAHCEVMSDSNIANVES